MVDLRGPWQSQIQEARVMVPPLDTQLFPPFARVIRPRTTTAAKPPSCRRARRWTRILYDSRACDDPSLRRRVEGFPNEAHIKPARSDVVARLPGL